LQRSCLRSQRARACLLTTIGLRVLQSQIKSIVRRRRDFEYAMNRRTLLKVDVLRYVTYEMNIEALRAKRKDRLKHKKMSVSDYAGVRRIHFIFNRALKRFKGDVRLWMQYIDYCMRSKSGKTLSHVFSSALQMHPRNGAIWLKAAAWEFSENGNINSARILLQRAVRINKDNARLWEELVRLEYLFVLHQSETDRIIGAVARHGQATSTSATDAIAMPAAVDGEAAPVMTAEQLRHQSKQQILGGAIIKAVITSALGSIKELDFRKALLAMSDSFPLKCSASISEMLLADVRTSPSFAGSAAARSMLAARPLALAVNLWVAKDSAAQEKRQKEQAGQPEHERVSFARMTDPDFGALSAALGAACANFDAAVAEAGQEAGQEGAGQEGEGEGQEAGLGQMWEEYIECVTDCVGVCPESNAWVNHCTALALALHSRAEEANAASAKTCFERLQLLKHTHAAGPAVENMEDGESKKKKRKPGGGGGGGDADAADDAGAWGWVGEWWAVADRAVGRFPADAALWSQMIGMARLVEGLGVDRNQLVALPAGCAPAALFKRAAAGLQRAPAGDKGALRVAHVDYLLASQGNGSSSQTRGGSHAKKRGGGGGKAAAAAAGVVGQALAAAAEDAFLESHEDLYLQRAHIQHAFQQGGAAAARVAYQRVLKQPYQPTQSYYALLQLCLQLEQVGAAAGAAAGGGGSGGGGDDNRAQVQRLFEKAVDSFGSSHAELWQQFCQYERAAGQHKAANAVYQRAMRALDDPSPMVVSK
jgi:hypothetical protein